MAEDYIQEIIIRKILVLSCLKNVVVYSRISSRDMLQWIVYMVEFIQILSANGRGGYHQERQGCAGDHIVLWS